LTDSQRRTLVGASALLLAALGTILLFAADAVDGRLFVTSAPRPLTALLGVALIAFGVMNWTAKGSILGGIYGRAIVVGNQTHFLGGMLVLLTSADVARGTPVFWAVAGVYLYGVALFTFLMLGSGVKPRS
jgi:hypothetical protein